MYSTSGKPTAALLRDSEAIVDHVLYWVACRNAQEANYSMAIINSNTLYKAVSALMPKGQFGARHLHKHLWKLPIPAFDAKNALHREVARAGKAAAAGAVRRLAALRNERGDVGVAIIRRELRAWLRGSRQGKAVEDAVGKLLASE